MTKVVAAAVDYDILDLLRLFSPTFD